MRITVATAVLALALTPTLTACGSSEDNAAAAPAARDVEGSRSPDTSAPAAKPRPARDASPRRARAPRLRVSTRIAGLNHPWDIVQLPSESLLVTERDPARLSLSKPGGGRRTVRFPTGQVYTAGETGLMGLEVDPNFAKNRRFYTCSGWNKDGGGQDIRVNAWTLNRAETRARLVAPLVTGLPLTSGRHGGCRLLITSRGALIVGTGDAAVGTNPRNLTSLGGKTLRVSRFGGRPWPTNPFVKSSNRHKRLVFTYGHRNVQGLAERADGTLWSVEHGSDRDDEVNFLRKGRDFGWNPVPGYDESVPMTDFSLPGKQWAARWRSGNPTVATSGSTFVYGKRWGALSGALAVAVLKDEEALFITFGPKGFLQGVRTPPALRRTFGRLRTMVQLDNGNLLVATDDDSDRGKVLLVRPRR